MGSVFLTFYNEKTERRSTSHLKRKGEVGPSAEAGQMMNGLKMEMEMVVTLTSFCFGFDSWMVGAACRAGDFSHFLHLSLQDRIERDTETKQRHGQRKRKRKSIIISFIFLLFFNGWPQQLWVFCRICPKKMVQVTELLRRYCSKVFMILATSTQLWAFAEYVRIMVQMTELLRRYCSKFLRY